ncbi:hypothetical protein [Nitrosovibrio tenuis]|uniref:hypothetical protein n=1 Tax=Nitrosovibrio tenuis TaxID=1233 RepID=UPI00115FFFA7|nr:hypothetical protein [Nitrosovibrio tenuis]
MKPNGKQRKELNSDTGALFRIGREAYKQLPEAKSKENFDNAHLGFFKFIDKLRLAFQEMKFKCKDSSGNMLEIDWSDVQDHQIVDVAWQIFSKHQATADTFEKEAYTELFLFHALIEIDNALICIDLGSTDAVSAAIEAANALSNAMAIESGSDKLQKARQEMAYQGAIARIKRDPKQKEKSFVFDCWQKWQQSPTIYSSKAAFARDMLEKCEHLASQKKIEDWCREWEKPNPAG